MLYNLEKTSHAGLARRTLADSDGLPPPFHLGTTTWLLACSCVIQFHLSIGTKKTFE